MCSVGKAKDQPLVPGSHDLEHSGFIDLLVWGGRGLSLGGKYSGSTASCSRKFTAGKVYRGHGD